MFFDFSIFGPMSCFLMFGIMIYYVFFDGRKGRRRSKYKAFTPTRTPEASRYPTDVKVRQNESRCRAGLEKSNKDYLEIFKCFITGDCIITKKSGTECYINTVCCRMGWTVSFAMVYKYSGLKDGSATLEDLKVELVIMAIRSITVYSDGSDVHMRIKHDDPDVPEDIKFVFHGPSAHQLAEEARNIFLEWKEEYKDCKYDPSQYKDIK